MKLPELTELQTTREMIDAFGGYNHNLRIGDGEFYDMTNLSSDDYPVLSPRHQRGIYDSPSHPREMIAKDALCYIDLGGTDSGGRFSPGGGALYINKEKINNLSLNTECNYCTDRYKCGQFKTGGLCRKTLLSMGAYIIILPDKKYINTTDYTDCGKIETSIELPFGYLSGDLDNVDGGFYSSNKVTFSLCKLDGAEFKNPDGNEIPITNIEPENPAHCSYWIDTSGDTHVLKQYSATSSQWTSVATSYIKIYDPSADFLAAGFKAGDGITISGIRGDVDGAPTQLNSTMVARDVTKNAIVVTGFIDRVYTHAAQYRQGGNPEWTNVITIERRMPSMDFVIESGNRLWGCRYGVNRDGNVVNEIYASKLGDFKNWNVFDGISTDSYTASLGTDGQFTGAVEHLGYPLFFKENCFHKVYGNYPANYQIQTTACRGVQKGCEKSLAIVNETLYYKARNAVCAYDGSLPMEVSSALGEVTYSDAVGGALGNKYYISMKDGGGAYHLFVLDTAKGMWHREDDTHVTEFCNCNGDLYFVDYADNQIKTVRGTDSTLVTDPVKWEAITGVIGTDSPDKKYISRMDIRLLLNVGTKVTIYAEYDSGGVWEHIFTIEGKSLRSFAIPIRPKRCDHLRLKFTGIGEAKIYSICKTIEQGSDT